MIYANGGYFHVDDHDNPTSYVYKDEGYDGVRSFAIATTKVTDEFYVTGWIRRIRRMKMVLPFIRKDL
ncbi:MAG: hypothetical protein A4E25_00128 [Methanobacterium sp. PtaB.Bin024]|jgi:hypothetical protein|nr:MAG: hypothetical protein A4E25_00128 [Methanobacterium sp. PtaB.Bin024]